MHLAIGEECIYIYMENGYQSTHRFHNIIEYNSPTFGPQFDKLEESSKLFNLWNYREKIFCIPTSYNANKLDVDKQIIRTYPRVKKKHGLNWIYTVQTLKTPWVESSDHSFVQMEKGGRASNRRDITAKRTIQQINLRESKQRKLISIYERIS